ncbi:metal transporter CNNM4-like [Haliotis cracherodii]|uniref:metal transporter CNNM4-like n=1 Tax=Haliotis cracherodii TaxID=6455 RepID=UPI0039ECAC08
MADGGGWIKLSVWLLAVLVTMCKASNPKTSTVAAILSTHAGSRDASGTLTVTVYENTSIRLIGTNFTNSTEISFTTEELRPDKLLPATCENSKKTKSFSVSRLISNTVAEFNISLEGVNAERNEKYYYLCLKEESHWTKQGDDPWLRLAVKAKEKKYFLLPLWLQIASLTILLCLSGLFSGLNLGLMALDKTELKIIEKCGSPNEKKYARVIVPLRKRGNFLLCTLLLGNVLVNNTLTILMDDLSNGLIAVIMSTIAIVIFGEIIPQAICSRHGLAIGARTRWITLFFMIVTFPLSFPISLLLDKVLGEEIGQVYNKEKLQELIRMTADSKVIQNEEANIIAGALQLSNKKVDDVMTKIEDVYMLDINTVLDFDTMSEIMNHGYTRIPVFDGEKSHIVNLLNTKDLTLIDPDDKTPLGTVCKFYDHRPLFVDSDIKLDSMLQDFLQGNSHMAIVQYLRNEGDVDPWYQILGVVTLEDVIEEIIQSEIIDETDILTDNRKKKPRRREKQDYSVFSGPEEENFTKLSPQLALAAFQFLWTSVEPFSEDNLTRNVLKRLLQQNIVVNLTFTEDDSEKNYLYRAGIECDYFILILQGHADVYVGKESVAFEAGPFSYFGTGALIFKERQLVPPVQESVDYKKEPYTPDFTIKAKSFVQYLRIRRSHYIAARHTSMMVRKQHEHVQNEEEHFKKEWHKALNSSQMSRNNSSVTFSDILDKKDSVEGLHHKASTPDMPTVEIINASSSEAEKKVSKAQLEDWSEEAASSDDVMLKKVKEGDVNADGDSVKEETTPADFDEEKTPLVGHGDQREAKRSPKRSPKL